MGYLLHYHHEVVHGRSRFEYQCMFLQRHIHRTIIDDCDNKSKQTKKNKRYNKYFSLFQDLGGILNFCELTKKNQIKNNYRVMVALCWSVVSLCPVPLDQNLFILCSVSFFSLWISGTYWWWTMNTQRGDICYFSFWVGDFQLLWWFSS